MRKRTAVLLILIITLSCIAAGCSAEVTADISDYGKTEIQITGIKDKAFIITPDRLADLKCTKASGEVESTKKTVTAVGPTLDTFLEQYGHGQTDYDEIIFIASDGYTTVLDNSYLTNHDSIILSVANGEKALNDSEKPLRLLIPDGKSSDWTKMILNFQRF